MSVSLKPKYLKRYKDLAWLLMKYGRSDLVDRSQWEGVPQEESFRESSPGPRQLADDLEQLGPTFVKLGQLLSTRTELLPPAYLEELSRLQDDVEPFSFGDVEKIIESELGFRISKGFQEFQAEPLAAASLGQVHKAILRNGRTVAVKVQRPGIRKQILEDLAALEQVASFIDAHTEIGLQHHFTIMLQEFRKSLLRELDYRMEAHHLALLRENLKSFDKILVPCPIEDYTTSLILTMEYVQGKKITSLGPLGLLELEGEELAEQLFQAYLKQILVDGFFHADPHPGNVFLTDDGRLALIDLGMVGHITPRLQENLLQLVLAVSDGRGEDAAGIAVKIGHQREGFDEMNVTRQLGELVAQHKNTKLKNLQVGQVVLEMTRIAGQCGLTAPPELTMLGKTLLNLDHVGRTIDPAFDPNASIRKNAAEILRQRVIKDISPGNFFATVVEMKEFVQRLPQRVNRFLDAASNNQLRLKVDAIDEILLIEGLEKIANRITMGLILAALIVGAAMLMRVETSFRILGYPGLAILLFMTAALGGLFLVINILWHDRKSRKQPLRK